MQESRERGKIDDEPNPKPVTGIHYCNIAGTLNLLL